jgi:hypothetical protein
MFSKGRIFWTKLKWEKVQNPARPTYKIPHTIYSITAFLLSDWLWNLLAWHPLQINVRYLYRACLCCVHSYMATYHVETNLSMQTMETSIWVTRCWSNGAPRGGGRSDLQNHLCKSRLTPPMNFANNPFHLSRALPWIKIEWLRLKFP